MVSRCASVVLCHGFTFMAANNANGASVNDIFCSVETHTSDMSFINGLATLGYQSAQVGLRDNTKSGIWSTGVSGANTDGDANITGKGNLAACQVDWGLQMFVFDTFGSAVVNMQQSWSITATAPGAVSVTWALPSTVDPLITSRVDWMTGLAGRAIGIGQADGEVVQLQISTPTASTLKFDFTCAAPQQFLFTNTHSGSGVVA